MVINCCNGCVAPKRYPGCHSHCNEYIAERAEYDRMKAIHDKERDVRVGIYQQRSDKAYKVLKNRRYKKI
jgi:hypothetical protein